MKLPNMRSLIIPDPGMVLIDMDLERADLYVVAWDSGCSLMKERLRKEDIHTCHAIDFLGKSGKKERDLMKKLIHAADYLVGLRTASLQTGLPESTIRAFLEYVEATYPEIRPKWHAHVREDMYRDKFVRNAFGYRRPFYDRLDKSLPTAVAWIAQSTVGLVINKILAKIIKEAPGLCAICPLLQVHDSLTLQVPEFELNRAIGELRWVASQIIVPYPDPLNIPVSFKVSKASWGDVRDYQPILEGVPHETLHLS